MKKKKKNKKKHDFFQDCEFAFMTWASWKHAYIILTPLNAIFI